MTIRRMEALALGEVLGSLLGAVVNAQAQAAQATVAFVEEVGFEATAEGDRLRTVSLRYRKSDENGDLAEFEVQVPLLAMVNVPSLAVKQAKLSFSYDVVTAEVAPGGSGTGGSAGTGLLGGRVAPVRMTGLVRQRPASGDAPDGARRTTAIDLEVTLEQQPIPPGIERLFDLAELGIAEEAVPPAGGA